jgi:hypothetical protein
MSNVPACGVPIIGSEAFMDSRYDIGIISAGDVDNRMSNPGKSSSRSSRKP